MNIAELGCTPGGVNNARIINAALESGERAFDFSPGRWRMDEPIRIRRYYAACFRGTGWCHNDPRDAGALIEYKGPIDQPVVSHSGYGLVWDGISIFGNSNVAGIHITENREVIGTGKVSIPHITIYNVEDGIALGSKTDHREKNADNLTMGYYNAISCKNALRVYSQDAVCHQIQFYRHYFCETGFRFDHGGKFVCRATNMATPGTLLSVGQAASTTGTYTLENTWVDNRAVEHNGQPVATTRLVSTSRGVSQVVCNGVHFPNRPYGVLFDLVGNSQLTLRDGFRMTEGLVNAQPHGGKRPLVRMRDCKMATAWRDAAACGTRNAIWSGCTDWDNELLPARIEDN